MSSESTFSCAIGRAVRKLEQTGVSTLRVVSILECIEYAKQDGMHFVPQALHRVSEEKLVVLPCMQLKDMQYNDGLFPNALI